MNSLVVGGTENILERAQPAVSGHAGQIGDRFRADIVVRVVLGGGSHQRRRLGIAPARKHEECAATQLDEAVVLALEHAAKNGQRGGGVDLAQRVQRFDADHEIFLVAR